LNPINDNLFFQASLQNTAKVFLATREDKLSSLARLNEANIASNICSYFSSYLKNSGKKSVSKTRLFCSSNAKNHFNKLLKGKLQ